MSDSVNPSEVKTPIGQDNILLLPKEKRYIMVNGINLSDAIIKAHRKGYIDTFVERVGISYWMNIMSY